MRKYCYECWYEMACNYDDIRTNIVKRGFLMTLLFYWCMPSMFDDELLGTSFRDRDIKHKYPGIGKARPLMMIESLLLAVLVYFRNKCWGCAFNLVLDCVAGLCPLHPWVRYLVSGDVRFQVQYPFQC